ncbi:MAG: family 10 glycosylhydrolase [Planctomycetes bacterium]|nr:family 10 glycosylhydrolase [Planctomycetota bacterium]
MNSVFFALVLAASTVSQPQPAESVSSPAAPTVSPTSEVRGTWLTTTANDALSTPAKSAATMHALAEIGINTVYVEVWKNGYTQFPSKVLERTVGVDRRPALMQQDPSDKPDAVRSPGRDLLNETLIEAHRNGLNYIAWFEYGFMAAHKSTDTHLRRMKKEWLSLDKDGNEVAPNGFVWMNPLHPEARRFLLDLVLEAVQDYDLDGIQLDDRIVWPYYTMGYDAFTKAAYAKEHDGKEPPQDPKDPEWMLWRSRKVDEFSKQFVQEIRAARPGLLISLSPAVYPWCYENYLLDWPTWSAWQTTDTRNLGDFVKASHMTPRWDEFIPQVYRMNYKAYANTWNDQVKWMNQKGGGRVQDLLAGIRIVGDGPDSTWDDLRQSMDLVRSTGGGGHVLWFSRGVLDLYPNQLRDYYRKSGPAAHPKFPNVNGSSWRFPSIRLTKGASDGVSNLWTVSSCPPGRYHIIADQGKGWIDFGTIDVGDSAQSRGTSVVLPEDVTSAEFLIDRRVLNSQPRAGVGQGSPNQPPSSR